jgi:hypothetical protein
MLQNLRWQAKESATDSAWRWITLSWLAVGIGSVYIFAARLSLSLLTPDGVAVFWPAAGVAERMRSMLSLVQRSRQIE